MKYEYEGENVNYKFYMESDEIKDKVRWYEIVYYTIGFSALIVFTIFSFYRKKKRIEHTDQVHFKAYQKFSEDKVM